MPADPRQPLAPLKTHKAHVQVSYFSTLRRKNEVHQIFPKRARTLFCRLRPPPDRRGAAAVTWPVSSRRRKLIERSPFLSSDSIASPSIITSHVVETSDRIARPGLCWRTPADFLSFSRQRGPCLALDGRRTVDAPAPRVRDEESKIMRPRSLV